MNKLVQLTCLSISGLFYLGCASSLSQQESVPAKPVVKRSLRPKAKEKPKPTRRDPLQAGAPAFEAIHTPLFDEPGNSLTIARATWVLATPTPGAARLGLIGGSTRVVEKAHVNNAHCPTPWVEVEPRGWICVSVSPSDRPPTSALPGKSMRTLPGTYAIATRSTVFYKSLASAKEERSGRDARGDMVKRRETHRLEDGRVFWRTDRNEYVDPGTLKRMAGSRFQGVDLRDEHGPMLPFGFAVHANNPKSSVVVRSAPSASARVVRRLSRRSVVEVLDHSDDGEFVRIGEGRWLARQDLRIVEARERPAHVEEGGRWIDVDLEQQLVVAYEGSQAVFATLASTGKGQHATPTGVFNITRKKRQTTMRSDRSKKQTYSVAVPWPMYFNKGFAFHSTYWHNNFGAPRSHGCINLSPTDAAHLYRFVGPEMPAGWTVVYGHESQPGTAVHVRSGQEAPAADSDQRLASQ